MCFLSFSPSTSLCVNLRVVSVNFLLRTRSPVIRLHLADCKKGITRGPSFSVLEKKNPTTRERDVVQGQKPGAIKSTYGRPVLKLFSVPLIYCRGSLDVSLCLWLCIFRYIIERDCLCASLPCLKDPCVCVSYKTSKVTKLKNKTRPDQTQ